jgi:hypothetical protein
MKLYAELWILTASPVLGQDFPVFFSLQLFLVSVASECVCLSVCVSKCDMWYGHGGGDVSVSAWLCAFGWGGVDVCESV